MADITRYLEDRTLVLLSNRVNPTRNNPRITAVRRRVADAVVSTVRARSIPASNTDNQ